MAKNKKFCVKSGWLFVWCISFYNGIFLAFFYVINLPVLWVDHGGTSPDLSNNYNRTLPVFDCLDRIYSAKFTDYKLRIFNNPCIANTCILLYRHPGIDDLMTAW